MGRRPDGAPRRRGWGEGSIRWKHGAWEITVRPYRGAPQDPWTRLPRLTVEQAEARLDLMVAQVRAGQYKSPAPAPEALSVAELCARYEKHLRTRVEGGTLGRARLDDIRSMMRCHILPAMGADPVKAITSDLLTHYMAGKRHGTLPVSDRAKRVLAPRTIRDHIELVGQMFEWACHHERRYAAYNPTIGLALPKINAKETRPYELEHARAVCRLLEAGTVRRIGVFALATGARIGEILGALETDWAAPRGRFELSRTLRREGGRQVRAGDGKTEAATRVLNATADLAALIAEQVADNRTLAGTTEPLFPTPKGTAWNPSNFRNRHWYPAVYAGYVKVMPDELRERWLAQVPDELRDAACLLALDETMTVRAVLGLGWDDIEGRLVRYLDADGNRQTVTLPAELAERLAAARDGARGRRVFPGKTGSGIRPKDFVDRVFRDAFRRAGVDFDRRIHRARHTYASILGFVEPDLTQDELQRRMGHSSPASTAPYRHVFEEHTAKPADVMPVLAAGALPDERERLLRQTAEVFGMTPDEVAARLTNAA